MPKATAAWLIKNTRLSFEQIARFCNLHRLEVQAIADGELGNLTGVDPVLSGELTREEISRCENDSTLSLQRLPSVNLKVKGKHKKYIPMANRQDKPDAMLWLIKHEAGLTDKEISKLLDSALTTVASIRNKTHWNYDNLKPRNPADLGLCSQGDLEKLLQSAEQRRIERTKA